MDDAAAATPIATEDAPPTQQSALVEEAARVATALNDKLPSSSSSSSSPPQTPVSGNHRGAAPEPEPREPLPREDTEFVAAADAPQPFGREEVAAEPAATAGAAAAQAGTRGRIGRRAATVGASVGENLRPRVEKLREASTVVFDEATDDPGLRFVIIAAALFLLFLFILLLSYILG